MKKMVLSIRRVEKLLGNEKKLYKIVKKKSFRMPEGHFIIQEI